MRLNRTTKALFAALALIATLSAFCIHQKPAEAWSVTLRTNEAVKLPGGIQLTDWNIGRDGTTVFYDGARVQHVNQDGISLSLPYSKSRGLDIHVGDNGTVGLLYAPTGPPNSRPHLTVLRKGHVTSDLQLSFGTRVISPRRGVLPRIAVGRHGNWIFSSANSAFLMHIRPSATLSVDPCDCASLTYAAPLCRCTVREIHPYQNGAVVESFRHNGGETSSYLVTWVSNEGNLTATKPVPTGARVLDVSADGRALVSRDGYVWLVNALGEKKWSFELPSQDSQLALASFAGDWIVVLTSRNEIRRAPLSWFTSRRRSVSTIHQFTENGTLVSQKVFEEPRLVDLARNGRLRALPDGTVVYGRSYLDQVPPTSLKLSRIFL